MAVERTFAIVKPDAVKKKVAGQILARIEESGLEIIGMKKIQLSTQGAQGFYAVHKERPFFGDLVKFMTSGRLWHWCSRARARSRNGVI